jgi:hypothetical protein
VPQTPQQQTRHAACFQEVPPTKAEPLMPKPQIDMVEGGCTHRHKGQQQSKADHQKSVLCQAATHPPKHNGNGGGRRTNDGHNKPSLQNTALGVPALLTRELPETVRQQTLQIKLLIGAKEQGDDAHRSHQSTIRGQGLS